MLLANPHLLWSDLFLWYEAQLTAPGIDAYGASLVGVPVLNIAFNDYQGWTHTVNTHDGWDAYELTLANGGYQFDGKVRAFETEEQILKVRQTDGTLRQEPLIVRRSVHGPIIGEKDGKAIALRVVGLDQPGGLEEWWDMARAKNLSEFEAALKRLQIPMFTVMYADRDGHILHLFNGQVPVRTQGDFESWSSIIPGNTSATLWTKTHPYRELPRVLDPPSGWLQNANDPPWTTTFPSAINPDNYPAYMAPRTGMGFRPQRSAHMLAEDKQISFEEADDLGLFRTLWFVPSEDQRFEAIGGESYVAVIEFSNPVRAMALMSYGNATQPEALGRGEQLKLFASKKLRPVWRSRQEIEAHLTSLVRF